MGTSTMFKNEIKGRKANSGKFVYKHYARKYKFNPKDFPKLTTISSLENCNDFGIRHIVENHNEKIICSPGSFADGNSETQPIIQEKGIVIGTIRMGFGHCRMSLALASAAKHFGYNPYWLDLLAFPETSATKTIKDMENWYNLGSRISQVSKLFNKHVWENLTSEGGRHLSSSLRNKHVSQIFAPLFHEIPQNMPILSTHPWVGNGAVEAGMKNVVNIIPDNYPLAFWLVEGSNHTVQSPSAYTGYRAFISMGENGNLRYCLPEDKIWEVGHYIDHEIVSNIEQDCDFRLKRMKDGKPRRFLLTMGGAGAQVLRFADISKHCNAAIKEKKAALFINMGDHKGRWADLKKILDREKIEYVFHSSWEETRQFVENARTRDEHGIHIFLHENFYAAIYATNVLMRISDVMVTKPSELSYYPVPKLFIQRVGKHEAWGAIRGSEIGDGTIETSSLTSMHRTMNLLIHEQDLMQMFCKHILINNKNGVYDGAYNAVKLAMEGKF
ncbi:MAG: DUF6938 domain-containing protein [Treponemataceae bacterium]